MIVSNLCAKFLALFQWRGQQLRYSTTLTILLALGAWGHHNHWKVSAAGHGDGASPHAHATGDEPVQNVGRSSQPVHAAVVGQNQVQFATTADRERSGIVTVLAVDGPCEQFIRANGVVGYDQTRLAQLSAKVPGTVWRVERKVGQIVEKGDILALIESSHVGEAKAQFLTAVARVNHLEARLRMLQPLESVVAARQIREAEAEVREARIQLYNTHQALVNLGLPIDHEQALTTPDSELSATMQFLGLPAALAASLDPATTTANLIPLVAPFDGVVIGRDVVLGEVALPTQAQFHIADCRRMWITLQVRVEDADAVGVGHKVLFQPDGVEHEVACEVCWISPEMDEKTRTVEVRAEAHQAVAEPTAAGLAGPRLLHVNSFGTGRVRTLWREHSVRIPSEAIQFTGDEPVVFVECGPNLFERRAVRLGAAVEDQTIVEWGVSAGDKIVTTGSLILKAELDNRELEIAGQPHADPTRR